MTGIVSDIGLGISGLLTGAGIGERSEQAETEQLLLSQQEAEETQRGIEQAEQAQRKIAKTLSQQKADEAATGFTGPSYGAISKSSFDAFLKDENAISQNVKFRDQALEARKKDIEKGKDFSIFNSLANFGLSNEDSITNLFK